MEKEVKQTEVAIEPLQFKKAALVLRAINNKLRQQMLQLIHQSGKITVTEIYVKLRLDQSATSQHLAILRMAGYVTTERNGKHIYYAVNYQRLQQVQDLTREILK